MTIWGHVCNLLYRGFRGAGGLGPGQAAAEITVDEFGGNGREGPVRSGRKEETAAAPRKNASLTAAALGLEGLMVPRSSCRNQGTRQRHSVCYTDVTHGPRDIIGLGLCRKVNCSDYTV